ASLEQRHLDPLALGFFDHAIVDRDPVGVFHMGERYADIPFLRRFFHGRIIDFRAWAIHVERRVPHFNRKWIPRLFLSHDAHGRQADQRKNGRAAQTHTNDFHLFLPSSIKQRPLSPPPAAAGPEAKYPSRRSI